MAEAVISELELALRVGAAFGMERLVRCGEGGLKGAGAGRMPLMLAPELIERREFDFEEASGFGAMAGAWLWTT